MLLPRLTAPLCAWVAALLLGVGFGGVCAPAQRHSFGSSPPTAPPPPAPHAALTQAAPEPAAAHQTMGPLQFTAANLSVLPPQALSRQLQADDERTREAALSALGAPGQYLVRGHTPFPHSLELNLVPLGTSDELDAILTVELEQHLVAAILRPEDGGWRRVGTVIYATNFADAATSPATFLHTARSLIQPDRYRAVFRGGTLTSGGDYVENEANVRILDRRAVITVSYVAASRVCAEPAGRPTHAGCELTERWLEASSADPAHTVLLMTATGHTAPPHELSGGVPHARGGVEDLHPHESRCQALSFSETRLRFEPSAGNAIACTPPLAH